MNKFLILEKWLVTNRSISFCWKTMESKFLRSLELFSGSLPQTAWTYDFTDHDTLLLVKSDRKIAKVHFTTVSFWTWLKRFNFKKFLIYHSEITWIQLVLNGEWTAIALTISILEHKGSKAIRLQFLIQLCRSLFLHYWMFQLTFERDIRSVQ